MKYVKGFFLAIAHVVAIGVGMVIFTPLLAMPLSVAYSPTVFIDPVNTPIDDPFVIYFILYPTAVFILALIGSFITKVVEFAG